MLELRRARVRGDADAGTEPVRTGPGDVPGPGPRGRSGPPRPDGRRRSGARGRSSPVPGARRLRPDLLPGPDRGPRPGLSGLDGRLAGILRARFGGLSSRPGLVRPGLRPRGVRPPGRAEHPDLRLEEPERPAARRAPGLGPDPADTRPGAAARDVRARLRRGPG